MFWITTFPVIKIWIRYLVWQKNHYKILWRLFLQIWIQASIQHVNCTFNCKARLPKIFICLFYFKCAFFSLSLVSVRDKLWTLNKAIFYNETTELVDKFCPISFRCTIEAVDFQQEYVSFLFQILWTSSRMRCSQEQPRRCKYQQTD